MLFFETQCNSKFGDISVAFEQDSVHAWLSRQQRRRIIFFVIMMLVHIYLISIYSHKVAFCLVCVDTRFRFLRCRRLFAHKT